jgi:hypothetical protein
MNTRLQFMLGLLLVATAAISQPTITSFTPASGQVGTSVVITGTNFSATATNNIVFFGATRATVTAATTTQLTVTVPVGATYHPITILVGGLIAYSSKSFVVTFANGAGIDATTFATNVIFNTGSSPFAVAMGDLDGDGKADIAVTNYASNTVSLYRNTSTIGAVSFVRVGFPTGTNPTVVSIGDLDGDGMADMAVTNSGSNTVSVFRNTSTIGTISYAAKIDFVTGTTPYSVSIGDIDGDGKADLAVANLGSNNLSLFRNTSTIGTISYATRVDVAAATGPISVSVGDIDGDIKSDIVVANSGTNDISVFRNTSTPGIFTFATRADFAAGSAPNSVAIGDLDNDGKTDVAVSNRLANTVSVFRNTGTSGTVSFTAKTDFATNSGPYYVAIGDMDGDGKVDMATSNYLTTAVSLLKNLSTSGTISFSANVDIDIGAQPYSVAIGDLDGDGKSDLATANFNVSRLSVFRNATKLNQTITFSALPTKVFGDAAFNLTATSSSALPVNYTSSNSLVAISGNTVTIVGSGSTTITASQAGDANYAAAISVARTLTVNKANQTITFGALAAKTFGDVPVALAATSSSGLAVSYVSSNPAVAIISISGTSVNIAGVGTTNITASQAGNANYNPATDVLQALTVNKANQTITFGALATKVFGASPFNLTASASSGQPISYTSSNTAVATVSGNTVTIVGAGTTTITASQVGNANYNAATSIPQVLTVSKANQDITFGLLTNKTVGDPAFALTATASSGLSITYSSSNTSVATISGNTVTLLALGTTTITASQPGNTNYNPASSVQQTLLVKQNQTISFSTLPDKTFGDAAFALAATASSSLDISYSSSNPAVATVAGNTVMIIGAGTTTITASQAGNAGFNAAADVDQTLTVNKASQVINFATLSNKTFGDAAFTLTATASSGLSIDYFSSNAAVATVSGSTITVIGAGASIITAVQEGNLNFNAATSVDQTLTVNKADQTITFIAIADKTVGDVPFSLSATASSGSAVVLSTTSNKIILTGNQVTIVSAGRAMVSAAQSGTNNYNAAASVERSFCIKPAKPVVTLSNPNTASPTLTSTAATGNQWYRNGTAIANATSATFNITQAGIYKVQVQVDDCISVFSDDQPMIVTAIEPGSMDNIGIYPNPALEELTIDLSGFEKGAPVSISTVDLLGRSMNQLVGAGGSSIKMDVRSFTAGRYIITLQQSKSRMARSFIKSGN